MKTIIPLTVLCIVGGPAIAEIDSNLYINSGGGVYRLESQGFDDTAGTLKLLGGYQINEYVAVEAAYQKLFETSDTVEDVRIKIDGDSWEVGTRLSYPFSKRFSGYGRLGWSFYDLKAKVSDSDLSFTADENGDGLTWAIGGRVNLSDRLALNTEYQRILIDEADADLLGLDLSYRFGKK